MNEDLSIESARLARRGTWLRSAFGRGLVPYACHMALTRVRQTADTWRTRLLALWWGVQLGEGSVFLGVPLFRRHPSGSIIIGRWNTFRSAPWSSTIGLNRRCALSAGRAATLRIGERCGFSATVLAAASAITLGNRVLCGANCTIVDTDRHPLDPIARAHDLPARTAPIVIEDDVWLGMNVTVLKGCHIGRGTVVAAGSVVTRSLPEYVLAGGVPATIIKTIQS